MKNIEIYHGSANAITEFADSVIYASLNESDARQFAEMNGDCGFVYKTEIELADAQIEEDFEAFDCGAYVNAGAWNAEIVHNPETGWVFVKNSASLNWKLI